MPASITSPADVVNLALARLGYRLRVGSLYEGSAAAKKALDIYGQTRDQLLRQNDWQFSERNVTLTLLKSAPSTNGYVPPTVWSTAYPPIPWLYEYAYPTDCLKVRSVKQAPMFLPNFDPQPVLYGLENDNSLTPAAKVILCNISDAILCYSGQVTNPASWEADFTEAMAAALARRLGPLIGGLEAAKLEASDESASAALAEMNQG